MFWRLTMYLQFAPKMEDICVVKVLSFCTWKYCKFGQFLYESHIRQERAVGIRGRIPIFEVLKNLQADNSLRLPKGKHLRWHIFSPYCSVRVWQKLYAIWEFYGEEEAFCLSRIACFGPLNISRSFKQLCQHQAHTVNHQPTKCGAADFHNRQNGTSRESDTFPIKFLQLASSSMFSIDNYMYEKKQVIKRKIQKKTLFPAHFSERW